MILESMLKLILPRFVVCWAYCSISYWAAIGPPLMSSHTLEMYTPQRERSVLEVSHQLEIRRVYSI